jgi:acyl phosphate:glycerol-3-phosphate acyltransferase
MWEVLVMAVVGYLFGSIPFGWLAGRYLLNIDVRDVGSGKTGFTNTMRALGFRRSILVLIADILKGCVPVVLAVAGHNWPVWLGFRGGSGVATGVGAALAMDPFVVLSAAIVFVACLAVFRIMSVASLAGTVALTVAFIVFAALGLTPASYVVYGLAVTAMIWWRHRANIKRLLEGTEPRIGQRTGPVEERAAT